MGEPTPASSHAGKRSDILAGALFALGLGMTLLLGPEWGWPFLLAGIGGVIVYLSMWRSSNPSWLNKALLAILAVFVVASAVVVAWKLYRPLPTLEAKWRQPSVPTPRELAEEFANVQREYERTHPTPKQDNGVRQRGTANGSMSGPANVGPCGIIQVGGIGNTATGGNCAPPQRHLTSAQESSLASIAEIVHSLPVYCFNTDPEGCSYAADFFRVFKAAGMDVGVMVGQTFGVPTDSKVYIAIHTGDHIPAGYSPIIDILKASGISASGLIVERITDDHIELWIGRN